MSSPIRIIFENGQHQKIGSSVNTKILYDDINVELIQSIDQSFTAAFIRVEQFLNTEVIPTIALGVYDVDDPDFGTQGTLRVGWFNAWELNKQFSLADALSSFWEMKFNAARLIDSVFKKSSGEHYSTFHIVELTGRSAYLFPSTPNTKPINMTLIWNKAINMLVEEFLLQLKFRGWDL